MNENIKALFILFGVTSVIGALTALGLSFTALSPLVIGGIVSSIAPVLLVVCLLIFKKDSTKEEDLKITFVGSTALASVAIGIGLTTIFPDAMIGAGSAALTGAVIGVLAFVAGVYVVDKVDEYIISPIIEHFSPKKGHEPVQPT
ncbi:MAG: hypothetical protein ACR5K9_09710 [Wolbachia sp.]